MKTKHLKILLPTIILSGIALLIYFKIQNELSFDPPSPKSDVPIIYKIGWWNNQDQLQITGLDAEVVESKLNLFNNKSLFQYSISGKLCNPKEGWRPIISKAHFAERYIQYGYEKGDTTNKRYVGEIVITPIVETIEDDSYKGDTLDFNITLQEIVQSANWGNCSYIIRCAELTDTLYIFQSK